MKSTGRTSSFRPSAEPECLADSVRREIAKATERTEKNKGMVLTVALNYGGRAEIIDACRAAVRRLLDEGNLPDELTEERIANELYTRNLPDLDLLVRTSGELRISNFSAVAGGLQRTLCDRNPLARLSPRSPARSHRRLSATRSSLRWSEAGGKHQVIFDFRFLILDWNAASHATSNVTNKNKTSGHNKTDTIKNQKSKI